MDDLGRLVTEQQNPASLGIDTKGTAEILRIINREDARVPEAVGRAIEDIAALVDAVVERFQAGGRLFYVGAGTSGRLGVLDAAECPPTFGTDPEMVQGIIAGGTEALTRSVEGAEDRASDGEAAVEARALGARDALIGITASGQAPFVLGAMKRARALGALVGAIGCNRDSRIFAHADHRVLLEVGPEIVTGSTRMKSGTAQKLVLNMVSTASMIRLGKVYNNLMVDLRPVNAKLVERSKRIVRMATDCDQEAAERAFEASGRRPKIAIVMVLLAVGREEAEHLLERGEGRIGPALEAARDSPPPRAPGNREAE